MLFMASCHGAKNEMQRATRAMRLWNEDLKSAQDDGN